MDMFIYYGTTVYVVIDAERVDEGIFIGGAGKRMYVKTELNPSFRGYYGDTVFMTRKKAEWVLIEKAKEKRKNNEEMRYLKELEDKLYREGMKVSICELCGKKSPLYSKTCECKPYIR